MALRRVIERYVLADDAARCPKNAAGVWFFDKIGRLVEQEEGPFHAGQMPLKCG